MNILISACLIGCNTRYDGGSKLLPEIDALKKLYNLIPVCPEQLGGLATPRTPAERVGERVITRDGVDVTAPYTRGAEETLGLAKLFDCPIAILKERSPSCGKGQIYDGTHSGTLTAGDGVTAALLTEHGIQVYGESRISELLTLTRHV